MASEVGCLMDREPDNYNFLLEALGNAEIRLIIIFDGCGEKAFFQGELSLAPQKLKDFLTLSSFRLSQRRKL